MEASSVLQIVLLVAGIAVCAMAVFALWVAVGMMRSLHRSSEEVRERLLPLLDKADVTIDAINAELLRIDGVVTRFEDVTERVSSTTTAVHDAVNAPMEALSAVGSGLRGAISTWRRGRRAR